MKIVVTHLTRMRAPFICVAGIDLATGKHVRPVLESGQLGRSLLAHSGGPFDIGAIVELGPTRYTGRAPETEDWRFDRRKAYRTDCLSPADVWDRLTAISHERIVDIFGPDLRRQGDTYAVDSGRGRLSLGCLASPTQPLLCINPYNKIRMRIRDGEQVMWLPVTDLRLYEEDHSTPRREHVRQLAGRIANGTPIILSVGLTRPFLKAGDSVARHWLQVNNVHLLH